MLYAAAALAKSRRYLAEENAEVFFDGGKAQRRSHDERANSITPRAFSLFLSLFFFCERFALTRT